MKKILMMVTIFLLLCGCSNEYNLTIKDGKFTEEINMTIPKSMIPVSPENMNLNGAEMLKMLSSQLSDLMIIEFYCSLNMNLAVVLVKILIML